MQTVRSEEDVSVDTMELIEVDSIATDTENLIFLHEECSQTLLFETMFLNTPVSWENFPLFLIRFVNSLKLLRSESFVKNLFSFYLWPFKKMFVQNLYQLFLRVRRM